jgi:Zn-dependent protease
VSPFHLFTIVGIPVFASPVYFLLLMMFGHGDLISGIVWAVCITLSLLTHEFGHALVARHLRHEPTIMLHGFGGLTARTRTGRDVEEAAIIAMGPAAGLALGLVVYGGWQLLVAFGVATPMAASVVYALLYPCITWNLLNLMPLWPLDGGQLLRLALLRWFSARRAARVTHGLALVLLTALGALVLATHNSIYTLVLLGLLALQNVRALRGDKSEETAPAASAVADELVENANQALREERFKDAARLAQQARAQAGVSPMLLDQIWEILGLATAQLGEYQEALSYLNRAKPNERVRQAKLRCLNALGREDEIEDVDVVHVRSVASTRGRYMNRWLCGALGFIAVAICMVFGTSLSEFFF